jgi:triphosphoribosyl-dephospho-CoA synthase
MIPAPATAHGVAAGAPARVGRLAVRALYHEAVLFPKPGLVSAHDNGAHGDMSLATFYRSIVSLRGYFPAMAALGAARAPWPSLVAHGRAAEASMLRATGGVNTHRGAIFHLGLVCAAAGALGARGQATTARAVCAWVRHAWSHSILYALPATDDSHGARVARRYGAGGARAEAASGYRSVRMRALVAYRGAAAATGDRERAAIQALFALIAHVTDSNLLWRGGPAGLVFAQAQARRFLAGGGVHAAGWREAAAASHIAFIERGLSPGGSADLLAVTLLLADLDTRANLGTLGGRGAAGDLGER